MHKNIIIGEGENDRIFLHELITEELSIDPNEVASYSEIRQFEKDVTSDSQRRVSIIEGGGSRIAKSTVKVARPFWYAATQVSIGVVGDLDRGPVYKRLTSYLNSYLGTKCKVHVFKPIPVFSDSERRLTIKLKKEKIIPIWTSDIPASLEIQIARALKGTHSTLRKDMNEDETIIAACKLLRTTREDIIRGSVPLLLNKKWVIDLSQKITRNSTTFGFS